MEAKAFSDISYQQFLGEEKLMGSKCKDCGAVYVPPRPICIKCHKSDMQWIEMKGKGKLAAFTCIGIGPAFMIEEGYGRKNPYCVGVVELEEGPRVDARIEAVEPSKPDSIKVGMPMTVKFLHRGESVDKKTYLAFEPFRAG
jgi:scaffold protein (connect acetoacetyl-CoA thiolase and HMG-CoA synthase)